MIPEGIEKMDKKASTSRRKTVEAVQFQSEITISFDQFFRFFNYYYPGKNKQDIINKCITGNTYWITIDALYYPHTVDLENQKISLFRKRTILKNGTFPPTKDSLQQEKFILLVRTIVSKNINTNHLQLIRETPVNQVIQYLEISLIKHEERISEQLEILQYALFADTDLVINQLGKLNIPFVRASNLFAYQHLEKEVINSSIQKAMLKQKEPRCDFCFLRQKDVIKCANCNLYTHSTCFARAPKNPTALDFLCDGCKLGIPANAQCQLCPVQNGHFLELANDGALCNYRVQRGEASLKFRILKQKSERQRIRQFIHVSCYVLRPECTYNLTTQRVQGFHLIDRSKKNTNNCAICGNMVGITVSCNNESCRRSYHPQCAKRNGLSINVIRANNKALLEIYCERHKKPESYQYLRDSVSNRVKELRKFYQSLDYQMKKYGVNHGTSKAKKPNRTQQLLKQDLCLQCGKENDYQNLLTNCRRCYGWYHQACCNQCPHCDS